MADALMGKTEVDAVSAEIIATTVQQQLIQESKLLPTVTDFSVFAVKGADKVKVPRAGNFTVNDKSENTAVDAQVLTYATDDISLDKHKVIQVLLEKYASLQSMVAAEMDMAVRAGKGMALQIDTDIISQLVLTSSSSPDHRIAYADTTLKEADFLAAQELLDIQNVPRENRFIGFSPTQNKSVMAVANFIQAERYGSNLPILSGEIGMAYGFRCIMHTGFTTTVAWHPSHVGIAIQQHLEYDTQKELQHLATRHSFDQVYGVKVLDGGKRGVLIGSAS